MYTTWICFTLLLTSDFANNKVDGDQTIGGVHFFEVHAPGGGMGLGIKIGLAIVLLALCIWLWMRYRAKLARRRRLLQPILTAAAETYRNQQIPMLPPPPHPHTATQPAQPCCERHRHGSGDYGNGHLP